MIVKLTEGQRGRERERERERDAERERERDGERARERERVILTQFQDPNLGIVNLKTPPQKKAKYAVLSLVGLLLVSLPIRRSIYKDLRGEQQLASNPLRYHGRGRNVPQI